jgi:Domain of unknown function DUF29
MEKWPMPEALYERDALAWAEQQAKLLRRLAAGERLNTSVDWPNVIEEVQDVGLSELRACQSLLEQVLTHLLKLHVFSGSEAANHWRDEIRAFLHDAQRRFTPSMRQRIGLGDLYNDAVNRVRAAAEDIGTMPCHLPDRCPFALDDLLVGDPSVGELVAKLKGGLDESA